MSTIFEFNIPKQWIIEIKRKQRKHGGESIADRSPLCRYTILCMCVCVCLCLWALSSKQRTWINNNRRAKEGTTKKYSSALKQQPKMICCTVFLYSRWSKERKLKVIIPCRVKKRLHSRILHVNGSHTMNFMGIPRSWMHGIADFWRLARRKTDGNRDTKTERFAIIAYFYTSISAKFVATSHFWLLLWHYISIDLECDDFSTKPQKVRSNLR